MSTFGRKALVWWDYENHSKENALRYTHTKPEIQLLILQNWYPIGMPFQNVTNWGTTKAIYEIRDYKQNNAGIYLIESMNNFHRQDDCQLYFQHPILTKPEENFLRSLKRQYKLQNLL